MKKKLNDEQLKQSLSNYTDWGFKEGIWFSLDNINDDYLGHYIHYQKLIKNLLTEKEIFISNSALNEEEKLKEKDRVKAILGEMSLGYLHDKAKSQLINIMDISITQKTDVPHVTNKTEMIKNWNSFIENLSTHQKIQFLTKFSSVVSPTVWVYIAPLFEIMLRNLQETSSEKVKSFLDSKKDSKIPEHVIILINKCLPGNKFVADNFLSLWKENKYLDNYFSKEIAEKMKNIFQLGASKIQKELPFVKTFPSINFEFIDFFTNTTMFPLLKKGVEMFPEIKKDSLIFEKTIIFLPVANRIECLNLLAFDVSKLKANQMLRLKSGHDYPLMQHIIVNGGDVDKKIDKVEKNGKGKIKSVIEVWLDNLDFHYRLVLEEVYLNHKNQNRKKSKLKTL